MNGSYGALHHRWNISLVLFHPRDASNNIQGHKQSNSVGIFCAYTYNRGHAFDVYLMFHVPTPNNFPFWCNLIKISFLKLNRPRENDEQTYCRLGFRNNLYAAQAKRKTRLHRRRSSPTSIHFP